MSSFPSFIFLTYLLMPVFHRRTGSGHADFPHPARQVTASRSLMLSVRVSLRCFVDSVFQASFLRTVP
jgi:hypothetical protein